MQELQEEEVIYEDEDEDVMEYVEVETEKEKIKNKKQLYMENDYSEQLESPLKEDNQDLEKCDTCGRIKLSECTCRRRSVGPQLSEW